MKPLHQAFFRLHFVHTHTMTLEEKVEHALKNIVLIGFMGCGKSAIGRRLAEKLNYPVYDTDSIIEEKEKRAIKEIFATDGEDYFRALETTTLEAFVNAGRKKEIISTGGGIVIREENIRLLQRLGFVVWLDAKPETVVERLSRNTDRPLLNTENPEETIRELSLNRRPLYESSSHLRLETDGLDFDEITTGIIESARYFFGTQ